MSIAAYIKDIGRGKEGARPLSAAHAHDLLTQIFQGQVSDLEIGAFCLAMRIKGETVAELEGFMQATHAACRPLPMAAAEATQAGCQGIVVLPSYNGARKLPNLTALLALELARLGAKVLVHGPLKDPTRVTSAEVFAACGLPVVQDDAALAQAWRTKQPAFFDIAALCTPLARLLDVRWTIGLRNPGHTVAKLINPFTNGLTTEPNAAASSPASQPKVMRVVNHTHPEYGDSLTAYLQHAQANALLMRGTEGEPVADARRQPKFEVFLQGVRSESLSCAPQEGVLSTLPDLPGGHDATTTAAYIREVISGQRALPASIAAQAQCLVHALEGQSRSR
jgi:anthranilate phosphoribosyltransferase